MGYLLDESALGSCTHGGNASPIVGNPRVKLGGKAVLTVSSQLSVAGCPNNVSGVAEPCTLTTFAQGATRVKVMGLPVLLESSTSTNVPTGVPTSITQHQTRVKGM